MDAPADRRLTSAASRRYSRALGLLVVVAALVGLVHVATGTPAERVLVPLGWAAGFALVSGLAWEVVVRQSARREPATTLAWIAFPVAVLSGLLCAPWLVQVVYPEIGDRIRGTDFTASVVVDRHGRTVIEVQFPDDTRRRGENLRLDSRELEHGFARASPGSLAWRDARTLVIDLAAELERLAVNSIDSVGINRLANVSRFEYVSGLTVPERTLVLGR